MSRSIDSISEIVLDGETFHVRNCEAGIDPMDNACGKCKHRGTLAVWCDIMQLGFMGDCNVVLFHCKHCEYAQAIRFWIVFDPKDEMDVTRYARENHGALPDLQQKDKRPEQHLREVRKTRKGN